MHKAVFDKKNTSENEIHVKSFDIHANKISCFRDLCFTLTKISFSFQIFPRFHKN